MKWNPEQCDMANEYAVSLYEVGARIQRDIEEYNRILTSVQQDLGIAFDKLDVDTSSVPDALSERADG